MSRPPGAPPVLLVLGKAPVPGRSKTRLVPGFGPEGAARLAAAALADTLLAVAAAPAARRVLVLDGDLGRGSPPPCGSWAGLTAGFEVVPQVGGDHTDRIVAAFERVDGPALLIGTDTPQVTPALLTLPASHPGAAHLGPAVDGGWWAMALPRARRDAHRVLHGVPTSTPRTGALQRERLATAGFAVHDLPPLRDVDEPGDAHAVAAATPGTWFAAQLRAEVAVPAAR